MNSEILLQRARLLFEQHRLEQAAEQLKQLLSQDPNDADAHALLALCLLDDKDQWNNATREAEQAIHLAPDQSFSHYVMASVLNKRSRTAEALLAMDEALRLNPGQSQFYALRASLLAQLERWPECLESASLGLQMDPDDTSCANMRSLALERLGRKNDALQQADNAVSRDPDSGHAHSMRGWALLQKGNVAEAQEAFREALRLEPTNEFARTGMIQALNSNNFLFRIAFKFHSFLGRLGSTYRWAIVIGFWVGMQVLQSLENSYPVLKPLVTPILLLYFTFCMLTWIADPLFDAFLRFHSFGKYLLSRKQKWASNLVAGLLFGSIALMVIQLARGEIGGAILVGIIPVLLTIPVSICFRVDDGWPLGVAIPFASLIGLFAIAAVAMILVDGPWWLAFAPFVVGILVCSFGGQVLMGVTVKR